jgi:hypothetical protein
MTTSDTTNETAIAHTIGAAGSLAVRVASWDVRLVGVAGDEVRVRNADGGPLPHIEVERGPDSLRIAQPSLLGRLGIGIVVGADPRDVRLVIEVPSGASVDVQSASGDLDATGLRNSQHYRTASGEVDVRETAGELVTETVSGDVTVAVEGSIRLTLRSVSGDVSVEGGTVERVGLTTTSGDLRVASQLGPGPHTIQTLSGDARIMAGGGVRVTAQTISGDIGTDLPHTSQGRPGRRSVVIGDGSIDVHFKSVSGDLRVVGDAAAATTFAAGTPQPPELPEPPEAPVPPEPPEPPLPDAQGPGATRAGDDSEATRLAILQALERGEIDIAEATDRLARLDEASDG